MSVHCTGVDTIRQPIKQKVRLVYIIYWPALATFPRCLLTRRLLLCCSAMPNVFAVALVTCSTHSAPVCNTVMIGRPTEVQGGPKRDTLLVFDFPLLSDALYLQFVFTHFR